MNNQMLKEQNLQKSIKRDDLQDRLHRFDNILDYKRSIIQDNIFDRMNRIDQMK